MDLSEYPDVVTPGEVADLFAVDAKTVTRWARSGKFDGVTTDGTPYQAFRTPGGHYRIPKIALEEWITTS